MRVGQAAGLMLVAVALIGCVDREGQKQSARTAKFHADKVPLVKVALAVQRSISEDITINGQVVTSDDTTVGAKASGRLTAVFVKDGDHVSAGQIIAQQDTMQFSAQLRQAQGQLMAAQAQLSQAISNARFNPAKTTAGVKIAEAALRSARAQLEKARQGARSEEIKQAEIQVQAAKASMETAKKERDRQLNLYTEGASSRQRYEQAENAYQQALAGYESALEMLEIRRNQTRPEDVSTAEEAVRQAEESLRNARAQKELDVTFNQQVLATRAQVATAQASVDLARQNMADTTIRSPFSGTVSGKPAQAGVVLGPGSPVARIVGLGGVYFEGQIPESVINEISTGRTATVTFDAIPGEVFSGTVAAVGAVSDAIGRMFSARITINGDIHSVKPGLFARGTISLRTIPDAVLVPQAAILSDEKGDFVMVFRDGKAVRTKITRGIEKSDMVEAKGLSGGEKVIVRGQTGLSDGTRVVAEPVTESDKKDEA